MKRNLTIFLAAILLIVASGLGYYYGYYVKTPVYSLQLIVEAAKNKDVQAFNKHVDVASVVNNWLEEEINKDVKMKNDPMAKSFVNMFKPVVVGFVQEAVNQAILHPDTNKEADHKQNGKVPFSSDLLSFKENQDKVKIKDITTEKLANGDSQVVLKLENTKTKAVADYTLFMRPLKDGTWAVYKAAPLSILNNLTKDAPQGEEK